MKDELLKQQTDHQRHINQLSLLRLVFFLSFLASLIGGYPFWSIAFILAFIVCVLRHTMVTMRLKIIQNKLSLIQQIERGLPQSHWL